MKLTKSLFMLCAAGLSLCACNSDDIKDQMPEGKGAVEVKIVPPQTRAATTGDKSGTTVEVTGNVYVTVVHNGGEKWTQKVSASEGQQTVKFYGVTDPTKVTVSMNGGSNAYSFAELTSASKTVTYNLKDQFGVATDPATANETFDLQAVKTVPVYGEAIPTLTGTIEKASNSEQYQMYSATVELKIPVARLEVSIKRNGASVKYKTLNAIGAYLDKLYSSEGVTYNGNSYPNITPSSAVVNYYYDELYHGEGFTAQGTGVSPLRQSLTSTPFVENEATTDVVGFNFYGTAADKVPHFKFIFTGAEAAEGQEAVPSVMYAKIINYKEVGGSDPIALNNGEIYQIIDLEVVDSNINMMEDDGSLEFGLTAIVKKAEWTIKQVTGTWAN